MAKKQESKNEVAVQNQNTQLAESQPRQEPAEKVLSSDVVIPKLLLQQGLSEFVNERKAQQGDIVRSTTAEKLGDDRNPVAIIPLTFQNLWMLSEDALGKGKYEFRGYEPRTALNENAEWDFQRDGTSWRRTKVMNLFALLPADIDAQTAELKKFEETGEIPDLDKALLPVVVSFRNTSFKAGKEVATLFAKAESISRQIGKAVPVYGQTLLLGAYADKNDKGSFFVFETKAAGKTKPEHREAAATWYETLTRMGANIKVDESDAGGEAAGADLNGPTNF